MAKIALVSLLFMTGMATAAFGAAHGTHQGFNGRPHGGNTAENMLLRRHHMTRAQYNRLRAGR